MKTARKSSYAANDWCSFEELALEEAHKRDEVFVTSLKRVFYAAYYGAALRISEDPLSLGAIMEECLTFFDADTKE